MKTVQLLLVEDDANIRNGLRDALEAEGYEVFTAARGGEGLRLFRQHSFHLAILDIMMPEMNGYELCREIRKRDARLPILFLTAKSEEIDKVVGLELGADDYLTKPFGLRELKARVAALLRRSRGNGNPDTPALPVRFPFASGTVDRNRFAFLGQGGETPLTPREMKLVEIFHLNPGVALDRNRLLDEAWGIDYLGTTRTLDQHVAQLRKKTETRPDHPVHLLTVHGVGYRYQPPAEAKN